MLAMSAVIAYYAATLPRFIVPAVAFFVLYLIGCLWLLRYLKRDIDRRTEPSDRPDIGAPHSRA
jgi:predicted Na+-dependent transporter